MKLLLAVSGGIDSAVLLHAAATRRLGELDPSLRSAGEFEIEVAHFNHKIHAQAGQHEAFVRELAKKYGLKFHAGKAAKKLKSEAEAREARYLFLRKVAKNIGAEKIATAHHAGDQAETALFNFVRGTSLAGLAGMAAESGGIWRPLLGVPKSQIRNYAKKYRLDWVEDPTNRDLKFSRNRIRLQILPELQQLNPQVESAVLRLAESARGAAAFVAESAAKWLAASLPAGRRELEIGQLRAAGRFLAGEIIQQIASSAPKSGQIERVHIEEILALIWADRGGKQKNCGGLRFKTERKNGIRVLTWESIEKAGPRR